MTNLIVFIVGLAMLASGLWMYSPGLSLSVVGLLLMLGVVTESSFKIVAKRKGKP